jgi:hypothetical protein
MPISLKAVSQIGTARLDKGERRQPNRLAAWATAALLHGGVLALLLNAPTFKPAAQSGAFGHSVSVTLVSASAGRPQASAAPRTEAMLNALADRLAQPEQPSRPNSRRGTEGASLADLMGPAPAAGAPGPVAPKGALLSSDDPFSRAFVSYRGDDPAKAASLESKAQTCARSLGAPLRVLVIIDAEGRLLGRPKLVGAAGRDPASLDKIVSAVERCAPYAKAATPGAPRSYEVEIN